MKITIDRAWKCPKYTISRLFIDGVRFYEALEDTDRGLHQSMPLGLILQKKVYGKTAIPRGVYRLALTYSPAFTDKSWAKKYDGKVPEILNVKGWSGVRIHPANTAEELVGCIAVGRNTVKGKVTSSVKVYTELMSKYLVPAFERGEEVYLEIK